MSSSSSKQIVVGLTSRYRGTPVYQDLSSGQIYFGPYQSIKFPPASDDTWVFIRSSEGIRLDLIASQPPPNGYGSPAYWWVIAAANDIQNAFTQIYGFAQYARSPLIFSTDSRPCFYATAVEFGENYNVDNSLGITFKTTPTTLEVFVAGALKETFTNLSPYPLTTSGAPNPQFWGSVPSAWVKINWVSPDILQPALSGISGPTPDNFTSYLTGGVDEMLVSLRLPSLSNVISTLNAAAAANN
jgi:hypothetical protein